MTSLIKRLSCSRSFCPAFGLRNGHLVERFLDSNHIEGAMQVRVSLMKRHFPARQHMIGFKESLN